MLLTFWCGIVLGEFFAYGCTTLRFPALPPAIRLLTYFLLYARMVLQVLDCLWVLLVDSRFWEESDLHPELIAEEAEEEDAPADGGAEVRAAMVAARRARRAQRHNGNGDELQLASNTPASNLFHSGRFGLGGASSSGASSPASMQLASSLPPVFALGAAVPSAAPSAVVRAVFADLRSASPAATEEFGSCCVICLGDFPSTTATASHAPVESTPLTPRSSRAETRVFLPCCHSFHRSCIDAWFRSCMLQVKPQVCPTCRHCPATAR